MRGAAVSQGDTKIYRVLKFFYFFFCWISFLRYDKKQYFGFIYEILE